MINHPDDIENAFVNALDMLGGVLHLLGAHDEDVEEGEDNLNITEVLSSEGEEEGEEDSGLNIAEAISSEEGEDHHIDEEEEKEIISSNSPHREITTCCQVCIEPFTTTAIRERVTCPECAFDACKKCVTKEFIENSATIFVKCMKCNVQWSLIFTTSNRALTKLTPKYSFPRLIAAAISRERCLVPSTALIAGAYRERKIVIEILSQEHAKALIEASTISVQKLRVGEIVASQFSVSSLCDDDGDTLETVLKSSPETIVGDATLGISTLISRALTSGPETENGRKLLAIASGLVSAISSAIYDNGQHTPSRQQHRMRRRGNGNNININARILEYIKEKFDDEIRRNIPSSKASLEWISRAKDINMLCRFLIDLPKEWWLSANGIEVSSELTKYALTGNYSSASYDRRVVRAIRRGVRGGSDDAVRNVPVMPCVTNLCRGFMYRTIQSVTNLEILACRICSASACVSCREVVSVVLSSSIPRDTHKCTEEAVASVKEIESTSRPCPSCTAPISRLEGCRHMFCPMCNQPYDWETLRLQTSNTNPEYHAWAARTRGRGGVGGGGVGGNNSGDISTSLRTVFSPLSRGEDGLTNVERNRMLSSVFMSAGLRYISEIIAFVTTIERKHIQHCVTDIPPIILYEKHRISFILRDITQTDWFKHIGELEMTTFLLQKLVAIYDDWIQAVTFSVNDVYNRFIDNGLGMISADVQRYKNELENQALVCAARAACEANVKASALFASTNVRKSFTTPGNLPRTRLLFPNAPQYIAAISRETIQSESYPNSITRMNGGHIVGNQNDGEFGRLAWIFAATPPTIVRDWCRVIATKTTRFSCNNDN